MTQSERVAPSASFVDALSQEKAGLFIPVTTGFIPVTTETIRISSLPNRWRTHPLVQGEFYYSLPPQLLDLLAQAIDRSRFDESLWQLEWELSRAPGSFPGTIGYFREAPINFSLLRAHDMLPLDTEGIRRLSSSRYSGAVERDLKEQRHTARRNLRAYAGWLMSSQQFLREHAEVWQRIRPLVADGNLPVSLPPRSAPLPQTSRWVAGVDEQVRSAIQHYAEFCSRWRLSRLVGPLLPQPLGPQMPAALPMLSGQQAQSSGYGLVAIPDTMPIPGEAELRRMLERAIRGAAPEHLQEWFGITRTGNPSRGILTRYARLFELQHCYRLLMSRHPRALHRQQIHLRDVLARYHHVSEDTIRRDLQLLVKRLGQNWWATFPQPPVWQE